MTQVAPGSADAKAGNAPITPALATTGFNFEGIPGSGSFPPDNNGSVGNNQYVEMVNSRYQVWALNRNTNTATSELGPVNINTLWAGFGGACQTQNAGDPIVLYDKIANRWFLSQFTSDADAGGVFYQCVAVSKTARCEGRILPLRLCRAGRRLWRLSALRRLARRLLRDGPPFHARWVGGL